jgi:hypothetical protein
VPDGVFTKLLRPCNLFNAQLGSRPAHNNLSKVKKNLACRVHLVTSWLVGTVFLRKIEKDNRSVAADPDPNHFAR